VYPLFLVSVLEPLPSNPQWLRGSLLRPQREDLNKTQAIQKDGTKASRKRPESEWLKIEAPELRIVPEPLSRIVDERLATTKKMYLRFSSGRFNGHPSGPDLHSSYLLSTIAQCAQCHGSLIGLKRGMGRWKPYYLCTRHHHRGPEICTNDLCMPPRHPQRGGAQGGSEGL